ncbi:MAG: lacto-N-biose phosphorylase central domain-containing protein [[Clostridium] scindens]
MVRKQTYSYFGILESLSGAAVDVVFLRVSTISAKTACLPDVDVIINAPAMRALPNASSRRGRSGWMKRTGFTALSANGYTKAAGFIGVGEPAAVHHGGRFQPGRYPRVSTNPGYTPHRT